jgi:hypothetical protein
VVRGREKQDPTFELDLENKTQLKTILFHILNLPIQRLTKAGKKLYGEEPEKYSEDPARPTAPIRGSGQVHAEHAVRKQRAGSTAAGLPKNI